MSIHAAGAALPDVDAAIAPYMEDAVAALDGEARLLAGMARYHLGLVDADLRPLADGAVDRGKRVRPAVAILCAGAAGGDPAAAAPLGAALELLHNFTLIHDDVQDESPTRRHRRTVWSLWGVGQAINAGDALFAAAHLPLYRLPEVGAPAELALRLLEAFDRMTVAIVEGQTLDLGFEGRSDVTPDDYIRMISGKRVHGTAALPGGMNKSLNREEVDYLLEGIEEALTWSTEAVELAKAYGGTDGYKYVNGVLDRLAATVRAAEIGAASWAQLLLKYILGHPAVTCVIPGMTRLENLRDNLGGGRGPLPDAALRRRMETWWDAEMGGAA